MSTAPESYIAAHETAERQQRRAWSLGLLCVSLHLLYFGFPILPFAEVQVWFPMLAFLPPLFALSYAFAVIRALRRWRRTRETGTAFVPIPPREESTP